MESLRAYRSAMAEAAVLKAERDAEIEQVAARYSGRLAELDAEITKAEKAIRDYTAQWPDDDEARVALSTPNFGYKYGTDKVAVMDGWEWRGTNARRSVYSQLYLRLPQFIRYEAKPNKQLILGSKDDKEVRQKLAKCGLEVRRELIFFINPSEA